MQRWLTVESAGQPWEELIGRLPISQVKKRQLVPELAADLSLTDFSCGWDYRHTTQRVVLTTPNVPAHGHYAYCMIRRHDVHVHYMHGLYMHGLLSKELVTL